MVDAGERLLPGDLDPTQCFQGNGRVVLADMLSGLRLHDDPGHIVGDEVVQVAKHAARALHRGGILVAYTPQITQAVQLRDELAGQGFGMVDTIEVLNRGWHIEGQSVRPDHRMVAHTGFLTHSRLLS